MQVALQEARFPSQSLWPAPEIQFIPFRVIKVRNSEFRNRPLERQVVHPGSLQQTAAPRCLSEYMVFLEAYRNHTAKSEYEVVKIVWESETNLRLDCATPI